MPSGRELHLPFIDYTFIESYIYEDGQEILFYTYCSQIEVTFEQDYADFVDELVSRNIGKKDTTLFLFLNIGLVTDTNELVKHLIYDDYKFQEHRCPNLVHIQRFIENAKTSGYNCERNYWAMITHDLSTNTFHDYKVERSMEEMVGDFNSMINMLDLYINK